MVSSTLKVNLSRITLILALLGLSSNVYAARKKYLVKMKDGKATPSLATKWSKVEGGFEFEIDTDAEVAKGKKATTEMVKASVEKKLAKRLKLSVDIVSDNKILIKYSGEEETLMKRLSKTRIKSSGVKIALMNKGSSGGIRANKISRKPKSGEVKASFISMDEAKGEMNVFIYALGPDGVPEGIKPSKQLTIKAPKKIMKKLKKDDDLFFEPVRLEGNAWTVKSVKLK